MVGVVVGVRIVVALLGRPREHWRARRWTVGIPLLVMIGLGALTAAMIARWEDPRIEGRFGFDAQKLVNAFRSELRLDVLAVQAAAHGQARLTDGSEPPRWMNEAPSIRSIGRVSTGAAAGAPALPVVEETSRGRAEDERILADASVQAALERALASGEVAASEPWTIGSGAGQQSEFLVWFPGSGPPSGVGAAASTLAYSVVNI